MRYIKTFFEKINEAKDYYFDKIRQASNKIWAIRRLGGKCIKCGEDNIFKLTFHHHGKDKEENISILLKYNRTFLEKEVDKCVLLCHNCHATVHNYINKNKITQSYIRKKVNLEYKQGSDPNNWHCEHPNHKNRIKYNNISIFDFHHKSLHGRDEIEEDLKKFNLSSFKLPLIREVDNLPEYIKKELDKCVVYCKNCHQYQHALELGRVKFVIDHEKEIENYILNPTLLLSKEQRLQIKNDVIKFINDNIGELSKFEMAKKASEKFNISRITFYRHYLSIFPEETGIRTEDQISYELKKEILNYFKNNHDKLSKIEIIKNAANLFKVKKTTIFFYYKNMYPDEIKDSPNFKEDIIKYIKKYHDKLSKNEIANKLQKKYGITKSPIYRYHKELYPEDSFNQLSNNFLKEIDDFIKNNHEKLPRKQIVNKAMKIFNINRDNANWRYRQLYPDEKIIWKTDDIINYIKDNHSKLSKKEIIENIFDIFDIKAQMANKYYKRLYPNEYNEKSDNEKTKEIKQYMIDNHDELTKPKIVNNSMKKFNITRAAAYSHYKKLYPEEKDLRKSRNRIKKE